MKRPRLTVKNVLIGLVATPVVGFGLIIGLATVAVILDPETWEESSADVDTEEIQQAKEPVERASSFIGAQEFEPEPVPVDLEPQIEQEGPAILPETTQTEPKQLINVRVGSDDSPTNNEIVIDDWGAYELTADEHRSYKVPRGNDAYLVPLTFRLDDGVVFHQLKLTLVNDKGEMFLPCPREFKSGNAALSEALLYHCVYGPDTLDQGVTFVSAEVKGKGVSSPFNLHIPSHENSVDGQRD